MPPIYHDSARPFSVLAHGDGTLVLAPSVVGKVSVSKRARNEGRPRMIEVKQFIDRGER